MNKTGNVLAFLGLLGLCFLQTSRAGLADSSSGANSGLSNRFKNRYTERAEGRGLLKWQWERLTSSGRRAPKKPIEGIDPDLDLIHEDSRKIRITWVGHATLLVQINGINILTDPHWGDAASPVKWAGPRRHQKPGIPFERLPRIDYVLLSHNHYDHLDKDTVQRLMDRKGGAPKFLVPLGVGKWFSKNIKGSVMRGENQNVFAMGWDEDLKAEGENGAVTFRFLAVQHWSARSLFDRYKTLWGSWAVLADGFTFWFSSDSGYSRDIPDIHQSIGDADVAAISIGGYAPRWFMKGSHFDPEEAVLAMKDTGAKSAIAIHWGTFENLSDEPLDEPPVLLRASLKKHLVPESSFKVPKHGQTLVWDGSRLVG
ncbi:MAG: metal-dependent hydrolase [Candidatus Omnitrophica bacterium ADurb.Bin277]|nr:MAG: metal-dependent hydrolase [Candidatus Omnitrophica bacterium ADurb.Bin277]